MTLWRFIVLALAVLVSPLTVQADQKLPVDGIITSSIGWRVDPFGSGRFVFHRGIDIAVPAGTPVRATRAGYVVHAGPHGGHGIAVIIQHGNGDRTLYGHNSKLMVEVGERADEGAVIALSGNTEKSTGPHVHYELLPNGRSIVADNRTEMAIDVQHASKSGLRYLQEQRMNEIVTSIQQRINGSNIITRTYGQGG
jgi:murein DD-endopeptidase MepM/ murein hydrolase activator NlpD